MNIETEFILDRIRQHEDSRQGYIDKAKKWEQMYRLDAGFKHTLAQSIAEGREQITLPTPFNVVNLSERLLASVPKIDVIPIDPTDRDAERAAETSEKWLTAMWDEVNWQQQSNVLAKARWQCLVRGRFALEVKWIKDKIPKAKRKEMLPFRITNLEPMNVGIRRGPITTEFAYNWEERSLLDVLREWPELLDTADRGSQLWSLIDQMERSRDRGYAHGESQTVKYIDYWETDPKTGVVKNAILVEDEFAKPLAETSYPDIPIIVGRGDFAVGLGDDYDGLSILHPLDGLWEYESRLASQMATALLWHFWPAVTVQNENGDPIDDIDIGPGTTTPVPFGTRIEMHRIEPNVPLAQTVFQQIESFMQQSTYSEVMFGQSPADLQSGYGVSLLAESAKGRIKNFQEGLEMGIAHCCRLVLNLIEAKGGKNGVDIYTVNERNNEDLKLTLNKEIISQVRNVRVRITPALPQDNAARVAMAKQLADSKYISNATLLDKFLDADVPTDETLRIALEELMQSDEMRPWRLRTAAEKYFKEDALDMLFETPFMPEPPDGFEWKKNERGKVQLEPLAPQGPPAGGPPMGPGEMPMGPEGGAAPGSIGQPIQPPMPLPGPLGGSSIPPVQQGMMEGESLGMPQDLNPLVFDQLMNTPASPDAQMRMAAGLPPEGTIPGVV